MEISEREYYELQMRVRSLQDQVDSMSGLRKTSLKDMVSEQAISRVNNLEEDKPVFGYSRFNSDAWNQFLALAKMVHEPSPMFYMDTGSRSWNSGPHIRWVKPKVAPKKIADLTLDQLDVSVRMLNEMIPVYNKYFKLMHQRVIYDPTGKGDYKSIRVLDEEMEGQANETIKPPPGLGDRDGQAGEDT